MRTQQSELLRHYINPKKKKKKKPSEVSHSGVAIKIRHCSVFDKVKKILTVKTKD